MSRNSFPLKPIFTAQKDNLGNITMNAPQTVTSGATANYAPLPVGTQCYAVQLSALTNPLWVAFYDASVGGATVASPSQTVATPGVFTTATQAWSAGQAVVIKAGAAGIAPGGFTLGTVYYVIATGLTTTACQLAATVGGTGIQCTASAACILQPMQAVTATTGMLVKATDIAEQYGISPGQYIAVIQQTGGGTLSIVEMTH